MGQEDGGEQCGRWESVSKLGQNTHTQSYTERMRPPWEKHWGECSRLHVSAPRQAGEQQGSVVLGPVARGKRQSFKARLLSLPKNQANEEEARAAGPGGQAPPLHQRQLSLIGLLWPTTHRAQDWSPRRARPRGLQARAQGGARTAQPPRPDPVRPDVSANLLPPKSLRL